MEVDRGYPIKKRKPVLDTSLEKKFDRTSPIISNEEVSIDKSRPFPAELAYGFVSKQGNPENA